MRCAVLLSSLTALAVGQHDTLFASRADLEALGSQLSALRARVEVLEAENADCRRAATARNSKDEEGVETVQTSLNGFFAAGRKLSSVQMDCCRWTQSGTCGTIPEDRFYQCTSLHEYLEHKTTVHAFEDVSSCLGSDVSKWAWEFQPASATAGVALKNDGATVAAVPSPLKVTHITGCAVPPKLELQLETTVHNLTVSGSLEVDTSITGTLTASGVNVAGTLVVGTVDVGAKLAKFPSYSQSVPISAAGTASASSSLGTGYAAGSRSLYEIRDNVTVQPSSPLPLCCVADNPEIRGSTSQGNGHEGLRWRRRDEMAQHRRPRRGRAPHAAARRGLDDYGV